ncbi:condensation domain-containing protein [Saccharothrix sp. S26]|uniref:condensation domain-containing protein n=1 Tax=Saccharothrix sp. S26 TaxID=2907215 RepID=UPI001F25DA23|nr:condensation domain-containing protein [Saccharothrix sp. S26]MCE6996436.1 condensation domain-containing protein [Saccharothrix sp. S26]
MAERVTFDRIAVRFSGPGAGVAPLTWGQKAILRDVRASGWSNNISGAHPVPDGATVDGLAERLGRAMGKHPALRTRLGVDADGRPCQVVAGSGEVDVEVVTFADELDRGEAIDYGNRLWVDWLVEPVEPWPVRLAVMRHRGEAAYLVLAMNHLVADGTAALLVMADLGLGELVGRRVDPHAPWTADLARREQSPRARRISDRAMRYWEGHLRRLPPTGFGGPKQTRPGERCRIARFHSPAAHLAVLAIARRTRADTSAVLLALIAVAIGSVTGVTPLTANLVTGNRFRPGLADVIGSLSQNAVLTLDLDGTVDDVVGRARQAATVAWLHAYYDPDQLDELVARLDAERGHPAAVACRISDRRFSTRPRTDAMAKDADVTPAAIRAKLPETFVKWDGHRYDVAEQLFVAVEDRPETVYLQLVYDATAFTAVQAETLLRTVEEVAVRAAFDPGVPTGVTARPSTVDSTTGA